MNSLPTAADVAALMEELAPLELKMEWDNVGLQLGDGKKPVGKILVTLTVTDRIVEQAAAQGVNLIVAHHPLIFRPLYQIRTDTYLGSLVACLVRHEIAVYTCHTNLDTAAYGLNHWLAEELGLEQTGVLVPGSVPGTGIGRVGLIRPRPVAALAEWVQEKLGSDVRIIGPRDRICERVAVCGGSGGDFVGHAVSSGGAALITGDVSYHDALEAVGAGLAVIDAGHHGTEKVMVPHVASYLRERLPTAVQILEDAGEDPFTS